MKMLSIRSGLEIGLLSKRRRRASGGSASDLVSVGFHFYGRNFTKGPVHGSPSSLTPHVCVLRLPS